MQINALNFHQNRRAFVIIPNVGIIWAEKGSSLSHIEILAAVGIPEDKRNIIIEKFPRGYFYNNTLVFYQGLEVKEGECWQLSKENIPYVRAVFSDIRKILPLNAETKVFLGVRRGKIGDVWEQLNQVPVNYFM